jgi:2Fe-2S ferredoxin
LARVTFIHPDGKRVELTVEVGQSLLEIAHANGIPIEGACEGFMACGTCHVIVDPAWAEKLARPSDEEQDMLDLVYGLTRRSRLGCQIRMTPELDGLVVSLPAETRNMM